MNVFSIGYQGRSLDNLCETLREAGTTLLVDVRERAWSQRPEFRKEKLRQALARHGISYEHRREAGNPFRPRPGEPRASEACAAQYRAHLNAHPEIIEALEEMLCRGTVALFCYEASTHDCHRGVLLSLLHERDADLHVVEL